MITLVTCVSLVLIKHHGFQSRKGGNCCGDMTCGWRNQVVCWSMGGTIAMEKGGNTVESVMKGWGICSNGEWDAEAGQEGRGEVDARISAGMAAWCLLKKRKEQKIHLQKKRFIIDFFLSCKYRVLIIRK